MAWNDPGQNRRYRVNFIATLCLGVWLMAVVGSTLSAWRPAVGVLVFAALTLSLLAAAWWCDHTVRQRWKPRY
jgi:hypothetical protein